MSFQHNLKLYATKNLIYLYKMGVTYCHSVFYVFTWHFTWKRGNAFELKHDKWYSIGITRTIYAIGIILYMRPANERRRYDVTSSLINWAHAQNTTCLLFPRINKNMVLLSSKVAVHFCLLGLINKALNSDLTFYHLRVANLTSRGGRWGWCW